jgi:ABC-type Fe3+-hydroxamate transport system substrate-binding protein
MSRVGDEAAPDAPQRIVSLVPSHTESLHALGVAARVVGRTRFCIHPQPWVDALPVVGGTKDAALDKILALAPELVVADKDENPKALVDALGAAGVDVLWSAIDTVEDAAAFVARLGAATGAPAVGARLAADIRGTLDAVRTRAAAAPALPVFCPIWWRPWMTFDATAYPHAMLAAVGLRNAFAAHTGPKYFEVEAADVAASDAAWTLLPTEPFPFDKQRERVGTQELGRAGRPERVRVIDGEALTWFGVRTVAGLHALADARAGLA